MEIEIKDKFDISDVKSLADSATILNNKYFNKLANWWLKRYVNNVDYIQVPLMKLMKWTGGPILRLLGMPSIGEKIIKLPEYLIQTLDGSKLATHVYMPKSVYNNGKVKKAPTLLIRLPYWKNIVGIIGYVFASFGYVTVLQDCRGTASSNPYGTLAVTFYLRPDGLTTLRWIVNNAPWYNGKMGMWGISFFGITQLTISWRNYDMLTCLNPAQCSYTSVLYHQGGLFPLGMAIDVYRLFNSISQERDPNMNGFAKFFKENGISDVMYSNPLANLYNEPLDSKRALIHIRDLLGIKDAKKLTMQLNQIFKVNLNFHAEDKDKSLEKFMRKAVLLQQMNANHRYLPYSDGFSDAKVEEMKTPMLVVASWADMFVEQILDDVEFIQERFPDFFKTKFKLVIGPGAHGGMDNIPQGLGLPSSKRMFALYQNFFPFWWFDYWLKNKNQDRDVTKIPPVRCWIVNKQTWRHFSKWPPKTKQLKFYLHSQFGDANSRYGQGKLTETEPKEDEKSDSYEFDPANPVPTVGGRFLFFSLSGYHNQNKVEERKDVLCYTSDKLKKGLEIIGDVKLIFHASTSAQDTDFTVKLVDVFNNRKALNIMDSAVRARFRDGLENPSLLEPNKIYEFEIKIGRTAWYFKKGHRIRIEISSSNFPKFDVHSNLVGEKAKERYVIAKQKIHHDAEHPSHLILPVFKEGK